LEVPQYLSNIQNTTWKGDFTSSISVFIGAATAYDFMQENASNKRNGKWHNANRNLQEIINLMAH
jgi:hypothetical protein